MYTNKRLPKRLTFSMVVVLAIILSFSMLITGFVTAKPVYAANYGPNDDYSSMYRSIEGHSIDADKKAVTINGRTDDGQAVTPRSYFPTQYLQLPSLGNYDLSGQLQDSLSVDGARNNYNTNPETRLFGFERKGGNAPLFKNNNAGLNAAGQSGNEHKWGEANFGKGLYLTRIGKNSKDFFNLAIYFTVALPDNIQLKNVRMRVTLDARGWGNKHSTTSSWHDRIESGMAIWAIDNPNVLFNKNTENSIGLDHNQNWVQNNTNGLENHIDINNAQKIMNHEIIRFNGNSGDQSGKLDQTIDIPNNYKYLRFMIAVENDTVDGEWIAPDNEIQILLSNLKISITQERQPEYNDINKLIPHADDVLVESENDTSFMESVPNAELKGTSSIIDNWTKNENLDLSKFATLYNVPGEAGTNFSNWQINNNQIGFTGHGNPAKKAWHYTYGYVKLPDEIVNNGGTIYISATTVGYTSLQQPAGKKITGHKYFSAVAGKSIHKSNNMNADELIDINLIDGFTDVQEGKNLADVVVSNLSDEHATTQSIKLKINPGERYLKLSYIHLFVSEGDTWDSIGQSIKDVKIDYARYSYPEQVNGKESDYVPGVKWETQGVVKFNAGSINGNNFESYSGGIPYDMWKTKVIDGSVFGHSGSIEGGVTSQGKIITYNGNNNEWKYIFTYIKIPNEFQGKTLYISADVLGFAANGRSRTYLSAVAGKQLYHDGVENPTAMESNKASGVTKIGISAATNNEAQLTNQIIEIKTEKGENFVRLSLICLAPENTGAIGQKLANVKISSNRSDLIAPNFVYEEGIEASLNALAINEKIIKFQLKDATNISVKVNNQNKEPIGNIYSFIADNPGPFVITMTNKFGEEFTKEVIVTNILKAGNNVSLTDLTENSVKVTVVNPNWQKRIVIPEGATQQSNVGNKASYVLTFDVSQDCSQTINAVYDDLKLHFVVNQDIDGVVTKDSEADLAFGKKDGYKYTATEDVGHRFIGWYEVLADGKNVLLTTDTIYTFTATKPMTIVKKYITIQQDGYTIEFLNLSDRRITTKSYNQNNLVEILANSGVTAPVIPFMEFDHWMVVKGEGTKEISVKAVYRQAETQFTVTINYADNTTETKTSLFNDRINLTGKDAKVQGWMIDGIKVSKVDNYFFYVTADVTIEEIKSENTNTGSITISNADTSGNRVITASIPDKQNYVEVGFIFAESTTNINDIVLGSNMINQIPVYSITENGQFIVAVDGSYVGKQVRMYTIDNLGNIKYTEAKEVK